MFTHTNIDTYTYGIHYTQQNNTYAMCSKNVLVYIVPTLFTVTKSIFLVNKTHLLARKFIENVYLYHITNLV